MKASHNQRRNIEVDFTFRVRPEPLPAELRPGWRIMLLLLMISRCGHGGAMSLKKAHLVCSASRSEDNRNMLLRMLVGDRQLDDVAVRFDPSLNRAIDYAIAERLVLALVRSGTCVLKITPEGDRMVKALLETSDCMQVEKSFAEELRGKLSNEKVEEILNWETNR